MPEEVSSNGCHQDDGPLTLRVQRMNADRLTVVVDSPQVCRLACVIYPPAHCNCAQTMVEALREKIRQQTVRTPVRIDCRFFCSRTHDT